MSGLLAVASDVDQHQYPSQAGHDLVHFLEELTTPISL